MRQAIRNLAWFAGVFETRSGLEVPEGARQLIEQILEVSRSVDTLRAEHRAEGLRLHLATSLRAIYSARVNSDLDETAAEEQIRSLLVNSQLLASHADLDEAVELLNLPPSEISGEYDRDLDGFTKKPGPYETAAWATAKTFEIAGWKHQHATKIKATLREGKDRQATGGYGLWGTRLDGEALVELGLRAPRTSPPTVLRDPEVPAGRLSPDGARAAARAEALRAAPLEDYDGDMSELTRTLRDGLFAAYHRYVSNGDRATYRREVQERLAELNIPATDVVLNDALPTARNIAREGGAKAAAKAAAQRVISHPNIGRLAIG